MILITGGTGFIGKYLLDDMIKKGYDIRLLVRNGSRPPELNSKKIEIFYGDATKIDSMKGIEKDIDVLVHMVGAISLNPEENFLANTTATKNIVKLCKEVDRMVYTSSADVYGPTKGKVDESSSPHPNNPYGKSKIDAEKIIFVSGIPAIIFRPTIVYGIGSPWWKYGMSLLKFGFVPDTDSVTQVVHVKDVSRALCIGVKKGRGIFNLADPEPMGLKEIFSLIVTLMGKKPMVVPTWLVMLASALMNKRQYFEVAMTNRSFSIEKAEKKLKWRPECDFNTEFRKMVDWYKSM